jgi:hypothetical protein
MSGYACTGPRNRLEPDPVGDQRQVERGAPDRTACFTAKPDEGPQLRRPAGGYDLTGEGGAQAAGGRPYGGWTLTVS